MGCARVYMCMYMDVAFILCMSLVELRGLEIPRRNLKWDSPSGKAGVGNNRQFSAPRRDHHFNSPASSTRSMYAFSDAPVTRSAKPTMPPQSPNGTYALSVRQFGAKGDAKADDTEAFQKTLDEAYRLGSLVVIVPPGQYILRGNLTVPTGCTLQGTYSYVPSHIMRTDLPTENRPTDGSVLLAYGGRHVDNGCLVTLNELATIRGFTIYYPEQVADKTPVPYPWSVCLTGINTAVTDLECLNCWNAIKAIKAHRHYIARVQGQPINTGVFVDEIHDIGRIEDVHFNPWFSDNRNFTNWQMVHGQAFVFGCTDWQYVFNTFAFAYAVGYRFVETEAGACNGNFLGIGADQTANASIMVDNVKRHGLRITNGEFTAFRKSLFGKEIANPTQVWIKASNTGDVRISNSAFWGPSNQIAMIGGNGTIGFTGCTFVEWDADTMDNAAIYVIGAAGNLIVEGCDFAKTKTPVSHFTLDDTLARAIIIGNTFATPLRIFGHAHNTQVGLNADNSSHSTTDNNDNTVYL
ncbi:uncharacterized protein LOC135824844 [Sycon ciliatum]|uniref:uncharacterized protein LOC135824844 n=1 Tax=Sycon ciliatum TaxID=27933 RepID=UPI0031F6F17E